MYDPTPWNGPLFVVGMPRSGTKLLRGLLNQHPHLGIPLAETEFLGDWARRWPAFGDLTDPAAFRRFWTSVRGSAYFTFLREEQGHEVDPDAWFAASRDGSLAAVFEALLRLDGGVGSGPGVWGDKSPSYLRSLPLLDAVFPDCRVLHIVRDCRDYARSINRAWGKDPLRAAQRWTDGVTDAHAAGQALGSARYLLLRYEDLLADVEGTLETALAFVGLSPAPGMGTLNQPTENLGDAKGQARVVTDNVEKWRSMDPTLRRQIEAIAGPGLAAFGYACDHTGASVRLSPARMAAGQVRDGYNLLKRDVAERGVLEALQFRARIFAESGQAEAFFR